MGDASSNARALREMVESGNLYYLRVNNAAQRSLHVKQEAKDALKAMNIATTDLPYFDPLVNQASLVESAGGATNAIAALRSANEIQIQGTNPVAAHTQYLSEIHKPTNRGIV